MCHTDRVCALELSLINGHNTSAHDLCHICTGIEGYDYDFIRIGDELHTYKDFKYNPGYIVKDYFVNFAIKASEELGFNVLHVCDHNTLQLNILYARYGKEWNYLPSIIEEHRNPKPKYSGPFGKYFNKSEDEE